MSSYLSFTPTWHGSLMRCLRWLLLAGIFSRVLSVSAQPSADELREQFITLTDSGHYTEALEVGQRLITYWRDADNPDSAAYYSYRRSHVFGLAGQHQACVTSGDSLLEVWRDRTPAPDFLGALYFTLGSNRLYLGMLSEGKALLDTSLMVESSATKPDTLTLAKATEWKGIIYIYTDSLDKAIDLIERALVLRYAVFDSTAKEIGYNLNSLAAAYEEQGRLPEAHDTYERALHIMEQNLSRDHPHVLSIMSNLSNIKADIGRVTEAIDLMETAIAGHKKLDMQYALMSEYFNLGSLYLNLGEYGRARPYMLHSLALGDSLLPHPHRQRANMYDGLGSIEYHRENHLKADSLFRLALDERLSLEETTQTEVAQSHFNLGLAAQEMENFDAAGENYGQAYDLLLNAQGLDFPQTINALYGLAEVDWARNDRREAIRKFETCLQRYSASMGAEHRWTLENMLKLSQCHVQQGDRDAARSYLLDIWKVVYPSIDFDGSSTTSGTTSFVDPFLLDVIDFHYDFLLGAPESEAAVVQRRAQLLRRATEQIMDELWPVLHFDDHNDFLLSKIKNIYEKSILVARRTAEDSASEREILNDLERSRAATIRAALLHRNAMQFAMVPDSIIERDRELRKNLKYIDAQLAENTDDHRRNSRFRILDEFRIHRLQLAERYPQWYQLRYQNTSIDRPAVHRLLGETETTLLAYVDIDTALIAVTATGTDFRTTLLSVPPGWRDSVRTYIDYVRSSHSTENPERLTQLGHTLYRMLWEPVKPYLGQRIRLLPDGILNYLNFETLVVEVPERAGFKRTHWLLRDHTILVANGLPKQRPENNSAKGGVLAIAPGFDDALKASYARHLPEGQRDSIFEKWVRTPWSVRYAEDLARHGRALTGEAATESQFRRYAEEAQVLHFGTHAQLQDDQPLKSYLALTPDSTDDGYLHAYELYNQKLRAQLALLTACETGVGTYRHGEGVISLAHALEYAGCPTVIYSLWQIDDEYSTSIISDFYKELAENIPISDALRNAKIDHIRNGTDALAAPYYWGGIVVRGEDDLVDLDSSSKHIYWWSASILLSVFTVVLFASKRRRTHVED